MIFIRNLHAINLLLMFYISSWSFNFEGSPSIKEESTNTENRDISCCSIDFEEASNTSLRNCITNCVDNPNFKRNLRYVMATLISSGAADSFIQLAVESSDLVPFGDNSILSGISTGLSSIVLIVPALVEYSNELDKRGGQFNTKSFGEMICSVGSSLPATAISLHQNRSSLMPLVSFSTNFLVNLPGSKIIVDEVQNLFSEDDVSDLQRLDPVEDYIEIDGNNHTKESFMKGTPWLISGVANLPFILIVGESLANQIKLGKPEAFMIAFLSNLPFIALSAQTIYGSLKSLTINDSAYRKYGLISKIVPSLVGCVIGYYSVPVVLGAAKLSDFEQLHNDPLIFSMLFVCGLLANSAPFVPIVKNSLVKAAVVEI